MIHTNSVLILTGWGWPDYVCAAAIACHHLPQAGLWGASKKRLPDILQGLASEKTPHRRVIILGVGLTETPDCLAAALRALKNKRVVVEWISCAPPPDTLVEPLNGLLQMQVFPQATDIAQAVTELLGEPSGPLAKRLRQFRDPQRQAACEPWRLMLEAAMYAYRAFRDDTAYPRAIRRLLADEPENTWTVEDRNLIELYRKYGHRQLDGTSAATKDLKRRIDAVAAHERARVLILGESGTGKETVAIQIHNKSVRRNEPFIAFNCASVAPELLESRFLGFEKGAFTGANERHKGVFEQADGGTLFLDEVGEMPLAAQGVLLRVLEGGRFTRIGEREEVEVDVRVIAATNRDLPHMVRDGRFREDLFYRLSVVPIRVRPLRERPEDIAPIAGNYWMRLKNGRLTDAQLTALQDYPWPGNVRELYNVLERAHVTGEKDFSRLLAEHRECAVPPPHDAESGAGYPEPLDDAVRVHVRRILSRHGGNVSRAAAALGITRTTLRKHLPA